MADQTPVPVFVRAGLTAVAIVASGSTPFVPSVVMSAGSMAHASTTEQIDRTLQIEALEVMRSESVLRYDLHGKNCMIFLRTYKHLANQYPQLVKSFPDQC